MPTRPSSVEVDSHESRGRREIGAKRWLNQTEAADYLGVTTRTVRRWIACGSIQGRRLPGSRLVRIDRLALDKALKPIPSARSIGGDAA